MSLLSLDVAVMELLWCSLAWRCAFDKRWSMIMPCCVLARVFIIINSCAADC